LRIWAIWERVSEDFRPFDVDVTTEDPGVEARATRAEPTPSGASVSSSAATDPVRDDPGYDQVVKKLK